MAQIVNNVSGRRLIKLSVDDILMVVSLYQEKCNCKNFTPDEVRRSLSGQDFYLPEEITSFSF
jgi:hypothetical protein